MKKHELLLKYLDLKISTLRENNLDEYDRLMRETEDRDSTDYHYVRGTYMGYENAMKIISDLLDDFREADNEH